MSEEVSDTPLTDAEEFDADNWNWVAEADFARRLERSITELNQRLIDRTAAFMADKAKDVARINALEAEHSRLEYEARNHDEAWSAAVNRIRELEAQAARQSQAVGAEWRLLKGDEIVEQGDEFLDNDAITWLPIERDCPWSWLIGTLFVRSVINPIRRRIAPNDSGKEGGE